MNYSIQKPRPSVALYLLSILVLAGLVALFLAADYAFRQIMESRLQAIFAAVLIEAGMIVEAIAVMRSKKNWPALVGLFVSLLVSGTYNYIQAEHAGKLVGIEGSWQLLTLALGPLSALTFLAMAVGRELGDFERRLEAWHISRQKWLEDQDARRQAREIELTKLRLANELKIEKAKARLQLRQHAQVAKVAKVADGQPGQLQGNRLRVYEVAKGNPDATHQEIAEQLEISRQAVSRHMQVLKKTGLIDGNHNGHKPEGVSLSR
jgi:biotin operon repressor